MTTPPNSSKSSCKPRSKSSSQARRIWDIEREFPRHVGYKLLPCRFCNRTFFANRLDYHQEVCRTRFLQPKRPVYDSVKFRISGTGAENFQTQDPAEQTNRPINPTWRENRETFRRQLDLEKGGIYSSPTPPPSNAHGREHSLGVIANYIQCPICGRRFNEQAGLRHIPHCKNYAFKK